MSDCTKSMIMSLLRLTAYAQSQGYQAVAGGSLRLCNESDLTSGIWHDSPGSKPKP